MLYEAAKFHPSRMLCMLPTLLSCIMSIIKNTSFFSASIFAGWLAFHLHMCVISHSSSYLRCQNQRELFSLLMMIRSHTSHRGRTILSMLLSFFTSYDSCMIFIRGGRHNKFKTRDHEKKRTSKTPRWVAEKSLIQSRSGVRERESEKRV